MHIVLADASNRAIAVEEDFTLDMQWGDDGGGNDFVLSGLRTRLSGGCMAYIDGTEFGGIVDAETAAHTALGDRISYSGRTWHGVLSGKVLCPTRGQSHVTVRGDANAVLEELSSACPIGGPFGVSQTPSGLVVPETTLPRFCTLYEAMRRVTRAAGGRLAMSATSSGVEISAVPARDWGDVLGTGFVPFEAVRAHTKVNHLVALGRGEMEAREVAHVYAGPDGKLVDSQVLVGVDEIAQVYELSNEEGAELLSKARAKLLELQESDTCTSNLDPDIGMAVGDRVTVLVPAYNIISTAEITGMVIKVERGAAKAEPRTGSPAFTTDRS